MILGTWLFKLLHGEHPGGLPNDLLTSGAASLLLFDEVLCDRHALAAEAQFAGRWVTSTLLARLADAEVLRPVSLEQALQPELVGALRQEWRRLETKGTLRAAAPGVLPEAVAQLNALMLRAVVNSAAPGVAAYDWDYGRVLDDAQVSSAPAGALPGAAEQAQVLAEGLSLTPGLVPDLDSRQQRLLAENIAEERELLHEWMLGREKHGAYLRLRNEEPFASRDEEIDKPRMQEACDHLDRLLEVRDRTAHVRHNLREAVVDAMASGDGGAALQERLVRELRHIERLAQPSDRRQRIELAAVPAVAFVEMTSVIDDMGDLGAYAAPDLLSKMAAGVGIAWVLGRLAQRPGRSKRARLHEQAVAAQAPVAYVWRQAHALAP